MKPKELLKSLELDNQGRDDLLDALLGEYKKNKQPLPVALGATATKAAKQETKPKNALASLKPEQRQQAEAVITALAEKFERQPEDFGVVLVESEEGEPRVVVMLTAGNGIYKGSYNAVMANKNTDDFMLEIDGRQVDTRPAITWDVYQAFINGEKVRGTNPLPDSPQLADQNNQPWTETWLTGEPSDVFRAYSGRVLQVGLPDRPWHGRGNAFAFRRVRPAVVLE